MADRPVPRLALDREEAAQALGVSLRHFQDHVQPHLPCVYIGGKRVYPVKGIDRWLDAHTCEGGRAI